MGLSLRTSLRGKLTVILFLVFFIPVAVILFFSVSYLIEGRTGQAIEDMQEVSDRKARQIEEYLRSQLGTVADLAASPEIQAFTHQVSELVEAEDESRRARFEEAVFDQGLVIKSRFFREGFSSFAVVDRESGRLLYDQNFLAADVGSTLEGEDGEQTVLQEISRSLRSSGIKMVRDGVLDHDKLYFGVPLYDRQGNFSSLLIAGRSFQHISLISEADYGRYDQRETFLVNQNSQLLTVPRRQAEVLTRGDRYATEVTDAALRNYPVRSTMTAEEGEVSILAAFAPVRIDRGDAVISDISWALISQLDAGLLHGELRGLMTPVYFIVFFMGLVVIAIAYMLAGGLSRPIREMTDAVSHLQEGYLDFQVTTKRSDEIGRLVEGMREMVSRIKEIVASIRSAAKVTGNVGTTISASVEQQSSIAVEQAGSVSEISSTMDEFASSFSQVSENVNAVSGLSESNYQHVTESAQLIESVADKMRDINTDNDRDIHYIMELKEKSKDISKVMEIISNISDQTKIISFNAALEASSAGESGRRFGVVASEIRKLTEDVMQSTANIDGLITEIQSLSDKMVLGSEKTTKNIHQGLEYSGNSVQKVESVVDNIKKSNESIKQIVLAVQQQQSAANQIQTGLKELSEGAKQNSEAIQSINESGEEFSRVTRELTELLEHFKLGLHSDDT